MKVKFIESSDLQKLEDQVNEFLKSVSKCEVTITSTTHKFGYDNKDYYVACILYK